MGQQPPATAERCRLLLEHWCSGLTLSGRERSLFSGQLAHLERQLRRLQRRQLRLAVFGRVGVGKSSLLNALLGEPLFATDVAHGCTRRQQIAPWLQPIPGLDGLELVDTPTSAALSWRPSFPWRPVASRYYLCSTAATAGPPPSSSS
jgi:hypothetical protein